MHRPEVNDALSIFAAARQAPAAIGLRTDHHDYTFAELAERAGQCLRDDRLRDDRGPYALTGTATVDTLVTLYALLECGRAALLLHPKLTAPEREAALAAAQRAATLPADAAAIVFTSGTTGEPRAAVLTRAALLASAAASEANLGWHEDDCWLLAMPIARVGGLSVLTRCLIARRPVARAPGFDAALLPQWIERHRATLVSLVPAMLERVLDAHPQWQPPEHLRAVLIGGAAASARLLARAAERRLPIVITYGCTETCSQVAATPYELRFETAGAGAGRPLAGVQLRIAGGHIEVRGPMRMAGYAGEPPLPAEDWFDTGDLGEIDGEGFLHVLGRADDLIVTGGENVYPAEVERVLESCPGVRAAAVFGVPDETWGQRVAAALVVEESFAGDGALARFFAGRLAPYKQPRLLCFLDALPQTAAGKRDREALLRLAASLRPLPFEPGRG